MERSNKALFIQEFGEKLARAKLAVVTDYKGLDVNTLVEFRKGLTQTSGTEFRVVKNTLALRALEGTDFAGLSDHMVGTNALLLGYEDVVESAKAISEFAKANKDFVVLKGGSMEGKPLTAEQVKALAELPTKEVMQAMLLGVLNAPARNFVSLLANVNRQIVNVLSAYKDKLEEEQG